MANELFVGRRAELARLRNLLREVCAGVGGLVLIEGEQGIGKSSLLRAAFAQAESSGCRLLWGSADEMAQRFPLRLMADCLGDQGRQAILGPANGVGAGGPERAAAGESPSHGLAVFAEDPVLASVERLMTLLDRWCGASPVVLVTEDLQWADEASLLAWYGLSRAVRQLPLLLAGACRPGSERNDLTKLRAAVVSRGGGLLKLSSLPDADVGRLVGRLVGGRPGPRLAGLVSRAGGNPLYVRELADGLVRDRRVEVKAGVAELAGSATAVRVPVSLGAAIAARLGSLSEDVVGVLRWGAVLGQEFTVRDLAIVTGRTAGELMEVVGAAVRAGVLADTGSQLGFRHGLIRQELSERLPTSIRTALRIEVAQALEHAGAAPEQVAGQLVAVPDLAAHAWALDWLASAAPALLNRAPQVVAELLRAALSKMPSDDPRRERLEASLVQAAFALMRYDEVKQVGGQALARAANPAKAAEMAWLVAYTLMRTGRADEAKATVDAALARTGASETQRARLGALRAITLVVLGDVDQAAVAAESAVAAAERADDPTGIGYSLHALSCVQTFRPDHAARLGSIDRALQVIGTDPAAIDLRLLLLSNRSAALGVLDRPDEALATAQQACVLAEHAGTARLLLNRTALALLYYGAGQWDDAIAELEQVVGLPGPRYHDLLVHGLFALIAIRRDQAELAERHLAAVADEPLHDAAHWTNAAPLLEAMALAAERDGRPTDGLALLARSLYGDGSEAVHVRYQWLAMLTRLALAAGDRATAADAADAAASAARTDPLPIKMAIADHCRGLVAGDPLPVLATADYYQRAARTSDRGEAFEDAAVLAAARGDDATARRALSEALGAYGAMAARWDARRASSRLQPYGIQPARGSVYPDRPATGWYALTPTELRVTHLLAAGRSNPDIAAELILSRNTVQTHVSHILAKLGARSRLEIARQALLRSMPPSGGSDKTEIP